MPSLNLPSTLNDLQSLIPRSLASHREATALGHKLLARNALLDALTLPVILGSLVVIIFLIGLSCMIKICMTPNPYDGGATK